MWRRRQRNPGLKHLARLSRQMENELNVLERKKYSSDGLMSSVCSHYTAFTQTDLKRMCIRVCAYCLFLLTPLLLTLCPSKYKGAETCVFRSEILCKEPSAAIPIC